MELSLPGLFAPWTSRSESLEPSLPGPFAPWPSRYAINRIIFAALAYTCRPCPVSERFRKAIASSD